MTTDTAKRQVTASYEYDGMADYWSGNGRRWDDDAACVFASIGVDTTYGDIIDEWMRDDSDFDGKEAWSEVSDDDIRAALVAVFVDGLDLTTLHPIAVQWRNELGHDADSADCTCDACTDKIMDYCQAIALLELSDDDA